MKKILLYSPFIVLFLISSISHAETTDNPSSIEMETIQVSNGYQMVVPKGAKVEQVGGQIKVQDPVDFLIQQFNLLEARVKAIEEKQEELKKILQEKRKDSSLYIEELKRAYQLLQVNQEEIKREVQRLEELFMSSQEKKENAESPTPVQTSSP